MGDVRAFVAYFSDDNFNDYWMEFGYKQDSINQLQENPAYLFLKDMPKGADTVLSFFYMGDVRWQSDIIGSNVKIEVVRLERILSTIL